MNRRLVMCLVSIVILLFGVQAAADDAADSKADAPAAAKYLLRYKFQPGETIRWKVLHEALFARPYRARRRRPKRTPNRSRSGRLRTWTANTAKPRSSIPSTASKCDSR